MGSEQNLKTLLDKCVDCVADRRYASLVHLLQTICYSVDDAENLKELQRIRSAMPIALEKFEDVYYISKRVDGRRRFVFKDIGPVRAEAIPILYAKYVIDPVDKVAMRVIGLLSRSKSMGLARMIEAKAALTQQAQEHKPVVVYDA